MSNNAAASDKGQAGLVIAIQLDDALGRRRTEDQCVR